MRRHRRIAETIRQFIARRQRRTALEVHEARRRRNVWRRRTRQFLTLLARRIRGPRLTGPVLARMLIIRLTDPEEAFDIALRELKTLEQYTFWELVLYRAGLMLFRYHHRRSLTYWIARRIVQDIVRHFEPKWPVKAVFHVTEYYTTVRDLTVRNEDPDLFDETARVVVEMTRAKATWETEPVPDENLLRWFLQELVAYYKEEICKSNMVAVVIRPVIYHIVRGEEGHFYVSRWTPVMVIRPDPWIRRAMPIDTHFLELAEQKPEDEWASIRTYAGEGPVDDDTEVVTARDACREPFLRGRVRDVLFFPYRVARDFARALGMPEKWIHITHCSLYFTPTRSGQMARRYRKRDRLPNDIWAGELLRRDKLLRLGRPRPVLRARRKGFT